MQMQDPIKEICLPWVVVGSMSFISSFFFVSQLLETSFPHFQNRSNNTFLKRLSGDLAQSWSPVSTSHLEDSGMGYGHGDSASRDWMVVMVLKMLNGPLLLGDLLLAQVYSCFRDRGNGSFREQCELQHEVGRPERGKESSALGATSTGCPLVHQIRVCWS